MPLFKCASSKSKPNKAINYITREDKAAFVSTINLIDFKPYARQFRETCEIFNKNNKFNDRKYYHFKLSADPKDNISLELHHKYATDLANRLFSNYECVIATHKDSDVVHSHIIINSIDIENGKKIRISPKKYAKMKDFANELGISYKMTPLDFNKTAEVKIDQKEIYIELKGGTSWKNELREVLDYALSHSTDMETFEKYLNRYKVEIIRNSGDTISFKHPYVKKTIRGQRLGEKYSRKEIINELNERQSKTNDRTGSIRLSSIEKISEESRVSKLSSSKGNRQQFNNHEREIRQAKQRSERSQSYERKNDNRIEDIKRKTDEQTNEQCREANNDRRQVEDFGIDMC